MIDWKSLSVISCLLVLSLFSVTESSIQAFRQSHMSHERHETRLPRDSTLIADFSPFSSSGIWSHVDAVVNLTNHFMKILPRKTVDKVVLFDSAKVNAIRIGVCRLQLHLGCQCTLSKRIKRSALAYRLQERQRSILFSPVRDSDEGLGMRVQVHFTDNSRRILTLRIRLKPKEGK